MTRPQPVADGAAAPVRAAELARGVYSAALVLATPLYFARLWWRGRREPAYRRAWAERLGVASAPPAPAGAVWIHAVSLGETHAAAPLIAALRAAAPDLRLLLTHGTATGREAGAALLSGADRQAWLPWDTPGATRRFIAAQRPAVGVLMETELWPNLIHAAQRAGVPIVLANARLSPRSLTRGRRVSALLRPALQALSAVLAQTDGDAARLRAAGAAGVQVLGNLKFDGAPAPDKLAQGRQWRSVLPRAVVLAASTREGEEEPLLQAWAALPRPRPLLLLVPRHPQRFDDVAALVQAAGLSLQRRSGWAGSAPPADAVADDVWLGDSVGDMALYYATADVALLGGSFAPVGGQNLIEAAACGCPVVMGPHTFNFAQAAELALQAGAAVRVGDVVQGVATAVELARAADVQRVAMTNRAVHFAAAHRGAAERMAREILRLLRTARR